MMSNSKNIFQFIDDKISPKLGNTIIYLAIKIPNLYFTKLLKLLYIIDEKSIEETGVPQTWLEYKVWKMGPVATDIYYNVRSGGTKLNNYIQIKTDDFGNKITPIREFSNGEFSNNDIKLIDKIINDYGHLNSAQLIDILHSENSLWHNIYNKENLKEKFKKENTSDFVINLTEKIKDDSYKMYIYENAKEAQDF